MSHYFTSGRKLYIHFKILPVKNFSLFLAHTNTTGNEPPTAPGLLSLALKMCGITSEQVTNQLKNLPLHLILIFSCDMIFQNAFTVRTVEVIVLV